MSEHEHTGFLDRLRERGALTRAEYDEVGESVRGMAPEDIRDALCEKGFVSDEEGALALAEHYRMPYVNLKHTTIDPLAISKIPADIARQHEVVPFLLIDDEISIAVARVDFDAVDTITSLTGCTVHLHLTSPEQVRAALNLQYYHFDLSKVKLLQDGAVANEGSSAIKDLSYATIVTAIRERASDIHIEPQEGFIRIRNRIDGILREQQILPREIQRSLVSRFKIMANLDIAETRHPQDGRISVVIGTHTYDLRVSIVPCAYGEKIVMRVLDKSGVNLNLEQMRFSAYVDTHLRQVISSANGIALVTGPTGSGKTTVCYAMLNHLNTLERNIVTIEDPVEYQFPVLTQIQVQHDIELGFASVLRAVLRQDPDVILVGEIRDRETGQIAAEAALTGHFVLSTLHTNNAVQAVVRLVELGVERHLVAPTILGVLAQRLVRKICLRCRTEYVAGPDDLKWFGVKPGEREVRLHRGEGCVSCKWGGYVGRMGVHELVIVNDEIRQYIMDGAAMTQIEKAAVVGGYRPMRYDGLKRVLAGDTTLAEVLRVTTAREDFE